MKTVAIMQPYFLPYAGYFRLFAAADVFVLYDCVQFPRRGWVHRNRLPDRLARPTWLTLPIAKAPRDAAIRDLEFRDDATAWLAHQRERFPSLGSEITDTVVPEARGRLVPFLARSLECTRYLLGLDCETIRSSDLDIDPSLHGQDRILAIAEAVGAKRYVNAPGGRALYDAATFTRRGLELTFLSPFVGDAWSVLHRLVREGPAEVSADVRAQTRFA